MHSTVSVVKLLFTADDSIIIIIMNMCTVVYF